MNKFIKLNIFSKCMKDTLISSKNTNLVALDKILNLKTIAKLHKIYDTEFEIDRENAWKLMPAVVAYTVDGPESKYFIISNKVVVDAMKFRGELDYMKKTYTGNPTHKGDTVRVYRITTDADLVEAKNKYILDKPFDKLKTIAAIKKKIREIANKNGINQNDYTLADIINREQGF